MTIKWEGETCAVEFGDWSARGRARFSRRAWGECWKCSAGRETATFRDREEGRKWVVRRLLASFRLSENATRLA